MADEREVQFLDVRDQDRGQRSRQVLEACEQLKTGGCLVVVNDYELEPEFEQLDERFEDCYSFDRFQVGMDVCLGVIHKQSNHPSQQSNGGVESAPAPVL